MSVAKRKKTLDGRSGTVTDLEDEDVEVGSLLIGDTTQSTSTITGALQCRGGVGISKNLYIGGNLNLTGGVFGITTVNATSTTDSSSTSTGAITTAGGVGIAKTLYCLDAKVTDSTASSSTSTGALVVTGGLGVGGNLNVGGTLGLGTLNLTSTTDSSSTSTGSLVTAGGVGVAKNITSLTNTTTGTTDSSSVSTGTIITAGGIGCAKTLYCKDAHVTNTTASSSMTTGALVVGGGLGVAGNYNLGGYIAVGSVTDSTSTSTGSITTLGGIGCAKSLYIGTFLGQGIQSILRTSGVNSTVTTAITKSTVVLSGGAADSGAYQILTLPSGASSVGMTIRVIGVKGSPAGGATFGGDYFMGGQPLYVTTNSGAQNPDQIHEFDSYSYYTYIDAHDYEFTFTNIGQIADQSANQYYTWECRCIRATCTGITVKWGFCWTAASNYTTTMSFQRLGEVVHWSTTGLANHSHNGSGNNPRAVFGTSTYTVLPFSFTPFNVGDVKFASTFQTSGAYSSLYIMFGGDQTISVQLPGGGGCASGESLGFQNYQCGTYFML